MVRSSVKKQERPAAAASTAPKSEGRAVKLLAKGGGPRIAARQRVGGAGGVPAPVALAPPRAPAVSLADFLPRKGRLAGLPLPQAFEAPYRLDTSFEDAEAAPAKCCVPLASSDAPLLTQASDVCLRQCDALLQDPQSQLHLISPGARSLLILFVQGMHAASAEVLKKADHDEAALYHGTNGHTCMGWGKSYVAANLLDVQL